MEKSSKVYCQYCKFFFEKAKRIGGVLVNDVSKSWERDEFYRKCKHPENVEDGKYYRKLQTTYKIRPMDKNRNNDCEWYMPRYTLLKAIILGFLLSLPIVAIIIILMNVCW